MYELWDNSKQHQKLTLVGEAGRAKNFGHDIVVADRGRPSSRQLAALCP